MTRAFEVGVVGQFEAAHRLHGNFGPATRMHGHTYRVELQVGGGALRDDGTLCDISLLKNALDAEIATLHLRDLDEIPALQGRNTTAEIVANHLFDRLRARFKGQKLSRL